MLYEVITGESPDSLLDHAWTYRNAGTQVLHNLAPTEPTGDPERQRAERADEEPDERDGEDAFAAEELVV